MNSSAMMNDFVLVVGVIAVFAVFWFHGRL